MWRVGDSRPELSAQSAACPPQRRRIIIIRTASVVTSTTARKNHPPRSRVTSRELPHPLSKATAGPARAPLWLRLSRRRAWRNPSSSSRTGRCVSPAGVRREAWAAASGITTTRARPDTRTRAEAAQVSRGRPEKSLMACCVKQDRGLIDDDEYKAQKSKILEVAAEQTRPASSMSLEHTRPASSMSLSLGRNVPMTTNQVRNDVIQHPRVVQRKKSQVSAHVQERLRQPPSRAPTHSLHFAAPISPP